MLRHRLTVLIFLVLAAGCASAGGGTDGPRRERNRISPEELAEVQDLALWDAVQRLRPMWLRPGGIRNSANPAGHYAHIFMDGSPYGSVESMRSIRVSDVDELRYVSATDATVRYGGQFQGGVILVTSRR
jgi:hypothetical protein